jgi:gliding motility-associated-like protein
MIKRLAFLLLLLCLTHFASAQVNAAYTLNQTSGCPNPFLLIASDNSTGPGAPTSWSWQLTGPQNFTSNTNQLSTTLNTPGFYSLTLTICYGAGNCDTETQTNVIQVFARPTVAMTYSPLQGCPPHQVCFDGTFTAGCGTIVSSVIDTKDGTVYSNIADVCHTYVNSGTYNNITVSVTNSCGCITTTTVNTPITVSPAPIANFSNTAAYSCSAPLSVTFTNTSTSTVAGTVYQWSIPGVTLANPNATNFTRSFSIGTYDVQLIVTNPNGCSDTILKPQLVVVGNPISNFTANVTSICANSAVNFTNTSSAGALSQVWTFEGHGTSSALNPIKVFTTPGTWDVKLVSTYAGGCVDSITRLNYITVFPLPVNSYTVTNAAGCQVPFTTSFSNTSTGATSTNWTFPGGTPNTYTGNGPVSITYNTLGNKNITMSSTSSFGCTASTTFPNAVVLGALQVQATVDSSNGCIPLTSMFSYTLPFGQVSGTQSWTLPGSNIGSSTAANPTAIYNSVGCNSFTLNVTTASGCVGTVTVPNAVCAGTPPLGGFTVTPSSICFEEEDVCVSFLGIGADTILWDFGDPSPPQFASPSASVCHSYSDDIGDFTITMIASQNGCSGDTVTYIDTVHVLGPISKFSSAFISCTDWNTFNFTDESIQADSVYWDFGDLSTTLDFSSLPNPNWVYPLLNVITTYSVTQYTYNFTTGCEHEVTNVISVFPPNAQFTYSDSIGCAAKTITFTNVSLDVVSNTFTRWNWVGTNQFVGAGQNVIWNNSIVRNFTYGTPGVYGVTMRNIDSRGCADTLTKPNLITIHGVIPGFNQDVSNGCAPLTVNFTDTSQAPLTYIASWQWDFGDLTTTADTSNLQNPTFTYVNAGSYNVTLTATDSFGCTEIATKIIVVNTPFASFALSDTFLCANQSVSITNLTSGSGLSYNWQFSNGTPSSSVLASPSAVTFNTEGFQTLFLQVTDALGCTDDTTLTLPVFNVAANAFASSDSILCFANVVPINFTNTSVNNVNPSTVFWDLGNGTSSNLMNPSAIYNLAGNYIVSMSISSYAGCRDTIVVDTIFVGGPFATIGILDRDTACICETINFGITTWNTSNPSFISGDGGIITYVPNGVVGDTILDTISYQYCQTGSFEPQIFIDDGTCSGVIRLSDTIRIDSLIVDFSVGSFFACDSGIVCFNDSSYNFVADTLGIASWTWDFGDGGTSNLTDPCHFYSSPGYYDVSLTVLSNFNCEETLIKQIYIPISPDVSIVTAVVSGCIGLNSFFLDSTVVDTNTFIQSWYWDFGDSSTTTDTSTTQNPSYVFNTAGLYNVTLTVVDTFGCTNMDSVIIEVFPLPFISAGPDVLICQNDSIQLLASGGISYSWVPNYNITNDSVVDPFVYPYQDTIYVVEGVDANGCPNWDTLMVEVNQVLANFSSISVCQGDTNVFVDLSTSDGVITSWTWNFDDPTSGVANSASIQSPTHYFIAQGGYNVNLTVGDSNGCQSDSSIQVFVLDAPTASFVGDSVCVGLANTFNSAASNGGGALIVEYHWDFGVSGVATDTSNVANPNFTYPSSGLYTVCLTITSNQSCAGNTDDTCFVVQVYQLPNASFLADTACFGHQNNFTDLSSLGDAGILTSTWNFGQNIGDTLLINGSPASTQFTYATIGQYSVSLTLVDSNTCADLTTSTAFLFAAPVADFSFVTACQNQNNQFVSIPIAGASSNLSYYWDFDEGAGIVLGDSLQDFSFALTGNHNVSHVISDAFGCSDTIVQAVNIQPAPTAVITGDNTVCRGTSTNLSGASSVVTIFPVTYSWNISSSQTSSINYSPNANNTILLTVTDGNGCFDTTSLFIDVLETPEINMTWTDACEDIQFSLSSNVVVGDAAISSYNWTVTSNNFGTSSFASQNVNFTVPTLDTLGVSLVIVDANNCIDSSFQTIFVDEQVIVDVLISDYVICPGDSLILNLNNPSQFLVSGVGSVLWSPNSGINDVNGDSVVLNPSVATTYTLIANSTLGQCPPDDNNVIRVAVAPDPFISVSAVPNPVLVGAVSNIGTSVVPFNVSTDSIIWDNSSGTLNTDFGFNIEASPLAETVYPFELIYYYDTLRCVKDTSITIFVITECNGEIIYVPNIFTPNDDGKNDEFKITGYGIDVINYIRIFDRWGQLMFEGQDIEFTNGRMNNGTGWQGDNKGGQKCNSGVFVYTYELICANGDVVRGSGNVTLIK